MFSDTFAGIAPASVPAFVVAQLVGGARRVRPDPRRSTRDVTPARPRWSCRAHGAPGLPRDAQDDERDREADERVSDVQAERHDGGGRDDRQRDVGVGAGVFAVGDERGAVEPPAGAVCEMMRGDPVAGEADRAGGGERAEVRRRRCGSIRRCDRFVPATQALSEDHHHDGETGPSLGGALTQRERDAERIAVTASPGCGSGRRAAHAPDCEEARLGDRPCAASNASASPTAHTASRRRLIAVGGQSMAVAVFVSVRV